MKIISNWLISTIAIIIVTYILPGVSITNIGDVLVLAVVLGIINAFIRPVILILTLPITIVTLGIFVLVINALLVMLASLIVPGFIVVNFWWALLFAVALALVHWFFHSLEKKTTYS